MEVFKESLKPYVTDSTLHWSPPEGFSLLETTPKSLGTIYSGSSHTAFALLRREGPPTSPSGGILNGSVKMSGESGTEHVTMTIDPTPLPSLTPSQSLEMASILDRVATWSKLQDMEAALASSSRKNSHDNEEEVKGHEPEPKRIKLNGSTLNGKMVDSELCNELIELSIASGIPCSLTCFHGNNTVQQLVPTSHTHPTRPASRNTSTYNSSRRAEHIRKMKARNRMREALTKPAAPSSSSTPSPPSMSSIALSTFTKLGTTFKNVASSFGLVSADPVLVPNGHCIDDHLQYQSQKKTSLHWDDARGKIVYPSYYRTNTEPVTNGNHTTPRYNGHRTTPSSESSSDDEDFISDTESNSSLDPDWDNLRQPSELRPLIQMQLYSGAWPMVRPFSYAVGVPLDEARKLNEKYSKLVIAKPEEGRDPDHSDVWTTMLAVCCLEEYFPELRTEWEVVALKGRQWVESQVRQGTGPSVDEIHQISQSLVTRWR